MEAPTSCPAGESLRILVVSNHWQAKKKFPSAAVFVDRQITSLRSIGVKISEFDITTSHSPLSIFRKWLALRREVRRLNPHLVHGQYGTIVGLLSAFAGRPAVVSFCGSDLLPGASVSTLRMCIGFLFSNLAALRAQQIICKSKELQRALWWRQNRAVVIPNGVDLTLFSPGDRNEARKALGWDLRRPIILFNIARDAKNKGLDLAEAAVGVARVHIPEVELCIISNVEPNLMPLYYRASDVLLCASKQEGSPNVVKEALACNLPVVSVPVGDVPERLERVHPSAVVPRDPHVMGEALIRILLAGERSNGREHIRHLALGQVAQRVLGVYRLALGFMKDPRDFSVTQKETR